MRNTRQGSVGSERSEVTTLQQLMDTVRALQEANEQYKRKQEWIQQEAKAEQKRLMAEAKAEQEKLIAKLKMSKYLGKINLWLR